MATLQPSADGVSNCTENAPKCTSTVQSSPPNAPQMHPLGAMAGLLLTSTAFAFVLSTQTGRKWDRQHTWFMTTIGVMFTLAWLAMEDRRAASRAFFYFVVSGMPIIGRALILNDEEMDSITKNRQNS